MWWVGQLNNYVPCSFVLDDDTTFLRKYAATLEASFAIPHPQIESTAWSADQECKPFYKNAACIRYKIFTANFTAKSEKKKRVLRFLVSWPNIVDWQCT